MHAGSEFWCRDESHGVHERRDKQVQHHADQDHPLYHGSTGQLVQHVSHNENHREQQGTGWGDHPTKVQELGGSKVSHGHGHDQCGRESYDPV